MLNLEKGDDRLGSESVAGKSASEALIRRIVPGHITLQPRSNHHPGGSNTSKHLTKTKDHVVISYQREPNSRYQSPSLKSKTSLMDSVRLASPKITKLPITESSASLYKPILTSPRNESISHHASKSNMLNMKNEVGFSKGFLKESVYLNGKKSSDFSSSNRSDSKIRNLFLTGIIIL